MKLTGRSALVFGGSSGIGRACVEAIAAEGASVVIADPNEAGGREVVGSVAGGGGSAIHVTTDITVEDSVHDVVARTVEEFGSLDILVTSAGASPQGDTPVEVWSRFIEIFLKGAYLASREVLPVMEAAGGGVITHVASVAGIRGANIGGVDATGYPSAKHGIVGLSRTLALHYGPHGIRVNALCPGYIKTPATKALYDADVDGSYVRDTLRVPLGRWGEPADIGRVVAFLSTDDASFISGQTIVVDGGMTAR